MNHKGIIRGVAEELGETVKKTGGEMRKQIGEGAKEAVAVIVGGSLPSEGRGDDQRAEERKVETEKAYWRRVIREQEEAGKGKVAVEEADGVPGKEKKVKEMLLISLPGEKNRRRFPWQKQKGAEFKDFGKF